MDCRDVRELADSFLAEELRTETNHDILGHLQSCPACRTDVAARRELRDSVRAAFGRAHDLDPRPEFIADLRTTLRAAAPGAAANRRRGPNLHKWWALAATIVVATAAGFIYRSETMAATALARAAAGDHRNCALKFTLAERPITLEEAERRYGAVYRVVQQLPPTDIVTSAGAAHVLERHACVFKGRRFAHVVLKYRGERVSLMVAAADPGGQPALSTPMEIDGLNVVSFRAGGQIVFIAGDVPAAELTALADSVAGPLGRELAGA